VYIHNGALFRHKEELNHVIVRKMAELEDINLSEISHTQKEKYCMFFSYVETNSRNNNNKKAKTRCPEIRKGTAGDWEGDQ
jgi:hypothetical protein